MKVIYAVQALAMSSERPITLIHGFIMPNEKKEGLKKHTDIVRIELIDSNKCSNSSGSQTPFCDLTNNREFAGG